MINPDEASSLKQVPGMTGLASSLMSEFRIAEKDRRDHEERWLDDLRQYRGLYDADTLERIGKSRCRLYMNITKQKVDATKARLQSLLFPSTSENNWSISPTPDPDVPEELLQLEQLAAMQEGRQPKSSQEIAKDAAGRMSKVIADQLAETQGRPNYRASCGDILHQGLLHGTGILKGPLVETRKSRRLARDPQTGMWGLFDIAGENAPYFEIVPIWNCYLDQSTASPEAMRYVWQTHIMSAKELLEGLATMPLFDTSAIRDYVQDHPNGDFKALWWEQELKSLSQAEKQSANTSENTGRFRVLERWGQLTGQQMRDAGMEIPEGSELRTFDAQIWMLGDKIIKIAKQEVMGFGLPYQLFYYHKDETSIWGEGLAWCLKDIQVGINAALRMIMDNAAITSGPMVGINVSALEEGQDLTELEPWKIFPFSSAQDMREAITLWQLTGNTSELLRIYDLLLQMADEMSVPRYMAGDNTMLRGAGETASGLSMLMNAANLTIQDLVRNFDDGVTQPFIRSLYLWNMVFNPDESIKGDYDVVAVGSSSLLAKEAEGQRLMQAMQIFQAPQFAGRIKEEELLKDILQKFNLPDHILRSNEEFEQWQMEQAQKAAAAQAAAQVQAVVAELEKRGVPPEIAMQEIMAMAAKMAMQMEQPTQPGQAGQAVPSPQAVGVAA